MSPEDLAFGSAVAAWVAVGVALLTVLHAWLASRRDAAFEHLREINERLRGLWGSEAEPSQAELVGDWCHTPDYTLSEDGEAYLAALTSLDLLGLAREKNAVTKKIVDEYLEGVMQSETVSPEFLRQLQTGCRDDKLFRHLLEWTEGVRKANEHKGRKGFAGQDTGPQALTGEAGRNAEPGTPDNSEPARVAGTGAAREDRKGTAGP